jgi:lipopolysaccharide transport system ATP-binding protein
MSDIAIRVDGVSKLYQLGKPVRYRTLRDTVTDAVTAPFRRLRGSGAARKEAEMLWALKDVSFEVKHGEVIGIIGRNGAGKSTLLKILARITEPTEGHAEIHGRLASLLEVGTGFHPELSGRENIFLNGAILGMKKAEILRKFDEIVTFAEVEKFVDTPVKHYSSGMYVRLAFAVAAHLEPDILVIDEVLAVGDIAFQNKCLRRLGAVSKEGRTVLFVSHNIAAVRGLCRLALMLEAGAVKEFGGTAETLRAYMAQFAHPEQSGKSPGILYEAGSARTPFQITKISMLEADGSPKLQLHTWDEVIFRIHYRADERVVDGSMVLQVRSQEGTSLLLCSTRPDSNVQMTISKGEGSVDCRFLQWPFSAGTYFFGAALGIPYKQWLTTLDDLAVLRVDPKDVFGSNSVLPEASRALIAVPHEWKIGA